MVFQRSSAYGSNKTRSSDNNNTSAMFSSGSIHGSTYRDSSSQHYSVGNRSSVEYSSTPPPPTPRRVGRRGRICDACTNSRYVKATVQFLKRCIKSLIWKVLMVFFSIFVLFGFQIRQFWIPSNDGDKAFDFVMIFTFTFFVLDILIRIFVEQGYFNFQICPTTRTGGLVGETKTCTLGSFLFWCDLLSTATILYDITFINKDLYNITEVDIVLDATGYPISGFENIHILSFAGGVEYTLLLTIARTARVARFVRSRTVVNASNKVNWYWFLKQCKWLNPFFYRRKIRQRRQEKRMDSLRMAGDESAAFVQTSGQDKRSSLGVLQIGMSEAVRSLENSDDARNSTEPRWNAVRKMVSSMRLLDTQNFTSTRTEAAIKIQRAWRTHLKSEIATSIGGSNLGSEQIAFHSEQLSNLASSRKNLSPRFAQMRGSRFQLKSGLGESQVGSDMRELTGQRVALGVLLSLVFTVIFTYTEPTTTTATAMILLHNQTQNPVFQDLALETARDTTIPSLFKYESYGGVTKTFHEINGSELKDYDKLRITVRDSENQLSIGWFSFREDRLQIALMSIVATLFIIAVWFFGVTAFAGPVMVLVVTPLERMVRLLGMLMLDPLGYQSTNRFQRFITEEEVLIKDTKWTKEVLKGMETSFLMSTILRIGSLMKVGFGSAGVEIIKSNLRKGQNQNVLILSSQGSTVSCIFLFCDIRQFTDATECLQEEVFVFTNRIAAVVHSICHSYGGAANKNVGDAFLLSWSLEDREKSRTKKVNRPAEDLGLKAKNNQGDKALLSVIKICLALFYDKFYLEPLSEVARLRLKDKVSKKRTGPVVQMGFGLHAGKAVQGAIGSQRKIDATYVSEAVKKAEFLESETKTYGLQLLMSSDFHNLLHPNSRRRCRKIDQVFIKDDDEDDDEDEDDGEVMDELLHIYTYDMDLETIFRSQAFVRRLAGIDALSESGSNFMQERSRRKLDRKQSNRQLRNRGKRTASSRNQSVAMSEEFTPSQFESNPAAAPSVASMTSLDETNNIFGAPELVLPTGPALYSHNIWQSPDMKRMREKYVQGLFFQKYQTGLQAFYSRDWETAKQCFQTVLDGLDDGPSRYFMEQIKKHNGIPPKDFFPYRKVSS